MNKLGLSVILQMSSGNEETINAIKSSLYKKISKIYLAEDGINIKFEDNLILRLWDNGQCCCESRYMSTDDNLPYFIDSILTKIELKDGGQTEDEDYTHEIQFLEITTSKGSFQLVNHNEHNGYYGGFYIKAEIIKE